MGRLLNPGAGDLADRLTILMLKLQYANLNADTTHLHAEQAQVQMLLERQLGITLVTHWAEIRVTCWAEIAQLARLNRQLWELEDRMAEIADTTAPRRPRTWDAEVVAEIGIQIWRANRARNAQITRINELAGTVRGEEKL